MRRPGVCSSGATCEDVGLASEVFVDEDDNAESVRALFEGLPTRLGAVIADRLSEYKIVK